MGLGFNFQYEIYIMRKSLNRSVGINTGDFLPYTFFIDTNVGVKETDKILEVSWSGGIISKVIAEYEIDDVNLYYEDKAPAYQIANCVKVSVSAPNQNLRYLQSILLLGVKST
jgi:hypothetical protein